MAWSKPGREAADGAASTRGAGSGASPLGSADSCRATPADATLALLRLSPDRLGLTP
jgi:hypothetical protein